MHRFLENHSEKAREGNQGQGAAIIITESENNIVDPSCTGTVSNENGASGQNPWPYLHPYFQFLRSKGKNLEFMCLLCRPKSKMLSANQKSLYNLKQHVRKIHTKSQYDSLSQGQSTKKNKCFGK